MKKLLLILLCVPSIGLGQGCDYGGDLDDAMELCNLMNQEFTFSTNKDADQALERILSVTGLAKNFILMPCDNVNNASAINYKGIRYILYNKDFMKIIVDNTDSWSNISILAHEIGHHLNAHTIGTEEIPTLSQRRKWELEADEFSGFIMYKLGATLEEAQEAVSLVSTNDDDTYSTHPSKDKRLAAIKKGYNNGDNSSLTTNANGEELTSEDLYFKSLQREYYMGMGNQYLELKDYKLALENYKKCTKIAPYYLVPYLKISEIYLEFGFKKESKEWKKKYDKARQELLDSVE